MTSYWVCRNGCCDAVGTVYVEIEFRTVWVCESCVVELEECGLVVSEG